MRMPAMVVRFAAAKNGRALARHPNLSAERRVYLVMLDRLKRAHYRRRFGKERGELVLRMERELCALPQEQATEAWIGWFWRQPPENWETALEARRNGEHRSDEPLLRESQASVPLTPEEAARLAQKIQASIKKIADSFHLGADEIHASRFAAAKRQIEEIDTQTQWKAANESVRIRIERLKLDLPSIPQISLPGRWFDWITALPQEAQEEAIEIKALFATMEAVHRAIKATVETWRNQEISDEERNEAERRYDRLRTWIKACDAEYVEVAEPFFERYGRPDLSK